jgi:hypothetical protein
MLSASQFGIQQGRGLRSTAKPPLARETWKIVVSLWLALVLGLFLGIRILNSETVTHLLRKFAAH